MKVPDPRIDRLLRTAIKQKRLIQFVFRDKPRIVEPHDYGIYKGEIKLFGYQIGGLSSEPIPNWRWAVVNEISDLRLLKQTFPGRGPTLSGKHHQWDEIFIRVEPPETEASTNDSEGVCDQLLLRVKPGNRSEPSDAAAGCPTS